MTWPRNLTVKSGGGGHTLYYSLTAWRTEMRDLKMSRESISPAKIAHLRDWDVGEWRVAKAHAYTQFSIPQGQNRFHCHWGGEFSAPPLNPSSLMIPTCKERKANDFPDPFFSHICKCAAKKRCVWNSSAFKDLFQMTWVSLYLERHWACQSLHRGTYAVCETFLTLEDMFQKTRGVCPQPWKAPSTCFSKSLTLLSMWDFGV